MDISWHLSKAPCAIKKNTCFTRLLMTYATCWHVLRHFHTCPRPLCPKCESGGGGQFLFKPTSHQNPPVTIPRRHTATKEVQKLRVEDLIESLGVMGWSRWSPEAARLQATHGKSMSCALEMEWDRLRLWRQILPDSSIYFIIFPTSLATRLELVLCPGWPCKCNQLPAAPEKPGV